MREFSKIWIDEKLDNRGLVGLERISQIVDKSLLDISNMVMQQDKKIMQGMKPEEIDVYMNVEIYFTLNDYLFWIDEEQAGLHTTHNCPICAKKHRVMYLIDALIRRWQIQGKKKKFEELVRFRADAMDMGRSVN